MTETVIQASFLPEFDAPKTWETEDDWETPTAEAKMVASLVLGSDKIIVDVGAGTGNITRFLPPGTVAVEANPKRHALGLQRVPHADWRCADFLTLKGLAGVVDLVIGNPPFSLLVALINYSFDELLAPGGRIVFLLPGDTFHKPTIVDGIKTPFALGERKVIGRISYLKDGKPQRGRQIYDSIFILRRSGETDPRLYRRQDFR